VNSFLYVFANPLLYDDPYGLWEFFDPATWPMIPQNWVNGLTGVANGASFGLAGVANRLLGQDVDFCSNEYQYGNIVGMFIIPTGLAARGIARGAFYMGANPAWVTNGARGALRARLGILGQANIHLHHWAISQAGRVARWLTSVIGQRAALRIINQPWNTVALPRAIHLGIVHATARYSGLKSLIRWGYAVPGWIKYPSANAIGAMASEGCGCGSN